VEAPSGDRGVRAVALSAAGVSYPIVAPARSGTTSAPPGSRCDCASQFRPAASVSGSFTCMRGLTRIAAQSYDAIAEAAGFCRATVVTKLRILEQLGIAETIRRKVVASFTRRVHRVRFDYAVADLELVPLQSADSRSIAAWRPGAAAAETRGTCRV
jgi:hypothetical protein